MSIEKHKAFLDSLDGDKGLTEKLYSWYFDDDLEMVKCTINDGNTGRVLDYLFERIRRAESRQIPELKEKVKELVRDAMDATDRYWHKPRADDDREMEQIRALCAIEGKP